MNNEEMAERLVEIEQRARSNTHRLDAVERNQEALNSIATSVAVMAEQQRNISDKVDAIDAKVDTLEGRPGRRWDTLADKAVWAVAAAVIACLLARVGL
nr:hypothetical protein [uncultured Oscillibacter sp.]